MDKRSIEHSILQLATERGSDKTICPSEVARALFPADWRTHMDEVRQVAFDLQTANKVTVTQKGEPVSSEELKGPIRIKIKN